MLIEFSVGNYKSFKSPVTLSLVATNIVAKNKELDIHNVFSIGKNISLLKSAAIYGANASGKSNFASAVRFVRQFVLNSSKDTQANEEIKVECFRLSNETMNKPSYFEIVFIIDNTRYRYGFEVTPKQVIAEWLYHVKGVRESMLYSRTKQEFKISSNYKEAKGLDKNTRENALFLSVISQFNGSIAKAILDWFTNFNIVSGLMDVGLREYTALCIENDENKEQIIQLIKRLNLDIDDISVEPPNLSKSNFPKDFPKELIKFFSRKDIRFPAIVKTIHRKHSNKADKSSHEIFDLDENESEGTKKIFSLAGPIIDTINRGKVLLIDEFDARLHPLITLSLIKIFNSNETNGNNAQLIFITHDTNLLNNSIFRRDQIWFAEKNVEGATDLYSLVEFKVRNDASFESDYIRGKYGAIPFLGDYRRLLDYSNEK